MSNRDIKEFISLCEPLQKYLKERLVKGDKIVISIDNIEVLEKKSIPLLKVLAKK